MTHEPPPAQVTIDEIVDRLTAKFPSVPTPTIREVVTQAYDELSDARVRDFVEVLVEKQAKKTPDAGAHHRQAQRRHLRLEVRQRLLPPRSEHERERVLPREPRSYFPDYDIAPGALADGKWGGPRPSVIQTTKI